MRSSDVDVFEFRQNEDNESESEKVFCEDCKYMVPHYGNALCKHELHKLARNSYVIKNIYLTDKYPRCDEINKYGRCRQYKYAPSWFRLLRLKFQSNQY